MESERERERTAEETDQISRSIKKMKRTSANLGDPAIMELESPRALTERQGEQDAADQRRTASYRDTLQRNNLNLTFDTHDNPIWMDNENEVHSDDDEPVEDDDPLCPTIRLTAVEKRTLREPWRNALIIRMFDEGIGCIQLKYD